MRRRHPRWGAHRISHEVSGRRLESAPSRTTVHRVLSRNGLVRAQEQQHRARTAGGSVRRRCTCGRWTWSEGGNCRIHQPQQATQPRTATMYHRQFDTRHTRPRAHCTPTIRAPREHDGRATRPLRPYSRASGRREPPRPRTRLL
ncbi:hypothetical protein ACIQNR_05675 [Streptomyces griseoviridis]